MLVHWIWFATRPELSDREKADILAHFSDPEDIYFADRDALAGTAALTQVQLGALADKDLTEAEEILETCREKDIHILTYRDAGYPARLKNIASPPLVLYYKGKLPALDGVPVIGVVGTRRASPYGLGTAKRMGYQIGKCGGVVVSGVAYGIDGFAMQGALSSGQSVVGILGCGVDIVYPITNRPLFDDLERHGCLISEFVPGTPPYKWNFPKRNRIISGLSDGVLIVEAPKKSGALITARQAAEQGRDVFVVPGNIDVPACEGSNALLRDGAVPVTCGWDILSEYAALYPDKVRKYAQSNRLSAYPDEIARMAREAESNVEKVAQKTAVPKNKKPFRKKNDKKVIDKEQKPPYSDGNDTIPALTATEQSLVDMLRGGELLVDDMIAASGLSAGLVLATLTMLEVKGVVTNLPGRRVALKEQNQ